MKKFKINPIVATYLMFNGLFAFAMSFFFATYVPFLTEKGMNLWQINAINASFMLFVVLAEMPTGGFADKFGRHRSLAVSCFLLSLSFMVYYFSHSFYIFILAEVIGAIGHTFASGAAEAWLVDSLIKRNELHLKDKTFRQELSSKSIGVIIGCLLGSMLGGVNLSLPWICSAVFMFLAGIFSLFFVKENYKEEMSENRRDSSLIKQINEAWHHGIKNKELLYVMGFGAIIAFSIQAINMEWTLVFKNSYNFSSLNLGFIFVAISLSTTLGGRFSKKLKSWIKDEKLALIIPQLITAIAIIVCSRVIGLYMVTAAFLLHEFGRGIFGPLKQSYLNNFLQSEKRATLLSLESMFVKLGAFSGLIITGFLAETYSIRWTWLMSGIFLAVGTIIFIIATKKPTPIPVEEVIN